MPRVPAFGVSGGRIAMRISVIYGQVMKEEELVQVLYRIPKSDRKALNIRAAEQEISATELVRRLIRQYVTNAPARQDA